MNIVLHALSQNSPKGIAAARDFTLLKQVVYHERTADLPLTALIVSRLIAQLLTVLTCFIGMTAHALACDRNRGSSTLRTGGEERK
jgi:hypothetical protein